MVTGFQKCLRDERDYFQYLFEYLKLSNAEVNAYFEREMQHLDICSCSYVRLSHFSDYTFFTIRILEKILSAPGEAPILYFLTMC